MPKYSSTLNQLAAQKNDGWAIHSLAKQMIAEGQDVIELVIGEPDIPTPDYLIEAACASLQAGRTDYSEAAGEANLRAALAARYSRNMQRPISSEQILCFPGTQTALYAVMRTIAGSGDEVIVGDPMYATYEGVITSSGATLVRVPLRAERGFRIAAEDIAARITDKTTAIFLNTPHNPTGAVLSAEDIRQIGELAKKHDLWLLADEVYDEMLFGDAEFHSPLALEALTERTIVVCSISKAHAAPGFRSGWCVGPEAFCQRLLPLSEAMLFGNQPFIADATAVAVAQPSPLAKGMAQRFAARAERLAQTLHTQTALKVHQPDAGMFALVDVSSTGMNGDEFAMDLLHNGGVGVMPGSSFGQALQHWVRVSLTEEDDKFDEACRRIVRYVKQSTAQVTA